jgi:hypothetical protein
VAHGVRDITSWPTAVEAARSEPLVWDRHSIVPHGGSRPASAEDHGARV